MKVISTEYSQVLGAKVAERLGTGVVDVRFSRFPDGEQYLRTGPLDGKTVIIGSVVNSHALIQLLLLIDACSKSENILVVPYMGYARQDRQFNEGEPLSARAVAGALARGVSRVITVNIHDERVLSHFRIPAVNVTLGYDVGRELKKSLTDPFIVAPDDGARYFAEQVALAGKWDMDHLDKTRVSGDTVTIEPKNLDIKNRDVVIVDDIISTGGTIATAASMMYREGAKTIHAACVHGVFTGGAYTHLKSAGIRDITCSDTIERAFSTTSAAGVIAEAVQE
ncbi:MAG TPA: ribose-phosphate diphosphokinase [Methanoregulaceae archaeon]|nr:ribose-phosphate diphosphokinase [Methanoregulaceae archaeon]